MVTSAPGNFQLREAIRETWANDLSTNSPRGNTTSCHVLFVLGVPYNIRTSQNLTVEQEIQNETKDDIITRITGEVAKKPIAISVINIKRYS